MSQWLTEGWETFKFLLTPEELRSCLSGLHFVICTSNVPVGYVESDPEEYLGAYEQLYDLLAAGERLNWKAHYPLLRTTGLTTDLARCGYGKDHRYHGKRYQSADFWEPCVLLSPMTLYVQKQKNGRSVSACYSWIQLPEFVSGLTLSYPKWVQYQQADGSYEPLRSTKELPSYGDFLLLKDRIGNMTKPLTFELNGKKVRPQVRVSLRAFKDAGNFYFFQSSGARV